MSPRYPLEILSFDGMTQASLGQGDNCVVVTIRGSSGYGVIVLTPDAAEAMARSLRKRAQYARLAHEEAHSTPSSEKAR